MATVNGTENADLLNADDGVTKSFDQILGRGGNDTIFGLGENDDLFGGAGADDLDGGAGNDFANYSDAPATVVASLADGGVGGHAAGDIYVNIEGLFGSNFNNSLIGDDVRNFLEGVGGNDTLKGAGGDDQLNGDVGDDTLDGGDGADNLFGAAGNDALDGGAGNDNLVGVAGDDRLNGGDGDDRLDGGVGADRIDGGAGIDRVQFFDSTAGVAVNLLAGTGPDGDTLSNVEILIGTQFDDSFVGDASANTLNGLSGDDILAGGAGADSLTGGSGTDRAFYNASTAAVTVDLELGTASGGHADGDVLLEFEGVAGSAFGDTLKGAAAIADILDGLAGDDTLAGAPGDDTVRGGDGDDLLTGGIGADTVNGGTGIDTAVYRASDAGVTVNLAAGTGAGGHALGDRLAGIEYLDGSAFADAFLGNASANRLLGLNGDDFLAGRRGNDTLTGGAGADELVGGAGSDLADYADSSAAVVVNLGAGTAAGGHALGDELVELEKLAGSRFGDVLIGGTTTNFLQGLGGDDRLAGGDGDDVLSGLAGDDTSNGGAGADRFRYPAALFGKDVINAFQDGSDRIDLRGSGLTFASFTETRAGANTVLTLTSNTAHTITLAGIAPSLVDAADFLV